MSGLLEFITMTSLLTTGADRFSTPNSVPSMELLLVEGQPKLSSLALKGLEGKGCDLGASFDGQLGLLNPFDNDFDAPILDVNLPVVNGFQTCPFQWAEKHQVTILLPSNLGSIVHKTEGDGAWADAYLIEPFDFSKTAAASAGAASPLPCAGFSPVGATLQGIYQFLSTMIHTRRRVIIMRRYVSITLLTLAFVALRDSASGQRLRPKDIVRLIYRDNSGTWVGSQQRIRKKVWRGKTTGWCAKYWDGRTVRLDPQTVWGYQTRDSTRYRLFQQSFYKVETVDVLTVYSQEFQFSDGPNLVVFYFSRNPDSVVFELNRSNLKLVFRHDECLLNKLEALSWRKTINQLSRRRDAHRVMEMIRTCQENRTLTQHP